MHRPVMADIDEAPPIGPAPAALDPFSYFADVSSKIAGLGGHEPRPEINYGFHTHYVRCALGHCHFQVNVERLVASYGVLQLQVNMISDAPGSHAKIATVERVSLADLAATGGRASVRFEALRGQTYALYGLIPDTTDAAARALTVMLDRPSNDADAAAIEQGSETPFGTGATRTFERLTADTVATLATPVSQLCTSHQFAEPAYAAWCRALGLPPARDRLAWERAYILQVLDRYGVLQHGARGIGFDDLGEALRHVLADRGCTVAAADRARLDIAEDKRDFLWSCGVLQGFDDHEAAQQFVEQSLARLTVGGLAVHTMPFVRDVTMPRSAEAGLIFSRAMVERIALNLVSRGHQTAQLKFELGPRAVEGAPMGRRLGSFGLIVRRGSHTA